MTPTIDFTFHHMGSCRFATISHSFEAFGHQTTVSGQGIIDVITPRSSHFWLQGMMGPRFDCPTPIPNAGTTSATGSGRYGGKDTSWFVANLAAFIAECKRLKINTVFCIGMCNDAQGTFAQAQTTITNFTTIAQAVTAAGMRFIISNDTPSGGALYTRTAAALRGFGRIQEFCMYELPRMSPLIMPVPIYHRFTTPAMAAGTPNMTYFDTDALHPNTKGHFRYAYELFKVLDKLFPIQTDQPISDVSYTYNATAASENKRGNMVANGMFNGAGPVATSWTNAAAATGIIVTPSVGADADGTPYQQLAYTGTPQADGAGHSFRQDVGTGNIQQGDKMRGSAYVLVKKSDAAVGYTNLRGLELAWTNTTTTPANSYNGSMGTTSGGTVGDPWDNTIDFSQFNGGKGLFFRTPEIEVISPWSTEGPFSRFTFNMYTESIAAGAVDFVVQIRQAQAKKTFASANF